MQEQTQKYIVDIIILKKALDNKYNGETFYHLEKNIKKLTHNLQATAQLQAQQEEKIKTLLISEIKISISKIPQREKEHFFLYLLPEIKHFYRQLGQLEALSLEDQHFFFYYMFNPKIPAETILFLADNICQADSLDEAYYNFLTPENKLCLDKMTKAQKISSKLPTPYFNKEVINEQTANNSLLLSPFKCTIL